MDSVNDGVSPENKSTISDVERYLKDVNRKSWSKGPEEGNLPKEIVDLNQEWNRQAQNLARLFAKELEFKTPEEYIATLPKFESQPEEYKGRLDIPIIVETRVPLGRMLELTDIYFDFNLDYIKDWGEGKFETPNAPYTVWVSDGISNLNKSIREVRKSLKGDERGATIFDGFALLLKSSRILDDHWLDIPGSEIGKSEAPDFAIYKGKTLGTRDIDIPSPRIGSVIAGRKIIIR